MDILITGCGRGLGLCLAARLAEDGHRVCATARDISAEKLLAKAELYPNIKLLTMNVKNNLQVKQAADWVDNYFGGLDALIANAGYLAPADRSNSATELDVEALKEMLETHVIGTAQIINHFHPLMREGSVFATITSEAGSLTHIGPVYPGYSISKAAQNKLTAIHAAIATDYRVFAIHPGRMNTDMGRTTAQIEPTEAADGIAEIVTKSRIIPDSHGWFIDYNGQPMDI